MKRLATVLTTTLLAVGGVAGWMLFGGCRPPQTRVAQRVIYEGAPTTQSVVEDWPRWRGPRGDGVSRETGLAEEWPEGGPRQLWSAEVGLGFASPVAAGGVVYLFTLNDGRETLTAFDAHSGRIRWSQEEPGGWEKSYPGTRATPAIDGNRIYTHGGTGNLVARDLASGNRLWKTNVLEATRSGSLDWGAASTPLVVNDLIYVQSGSGGNVAVAVRKDDGSVAWKSEGRGNGGYAHPILADLGGGASQLVVFGGDRIFGMDPASGRTIWDVPWSTSYDVNGSTPVYRDGYLFVTSAYGQGSIMLRLSPTGAQVVWQKPAIQSRFQPAILDGDTLYVNSEGTLTALAWPDGDVRWQAGEKELKLGNGGTLIRAGDKFLALGERGKLSLLRATPQGYDLLDQAEVVDGRYVWATPLLYGGRLYAKGDQEFICFDVSGSDMAATGGATPGRRSSASR